MDKRLIVSGKRIGRPSKGRNRLSRYIRENHLTSTAFAASLEDRGQKPHPVTVRNWMSGKPISERWRAVIGERHPGCFGR